MLADILEEDPGAENVGTVSKVLSINPTRSRIDKWVQEKPGGSKTGAKSKPARTVSGSHQAPEAQRRTAAKTRERTKYDTIVIQFIYI